MKNSTINKIINKIIKTNNPMIERIKYEDYDGYYNVWKIEDNEKKYILKQVKDIELDMYENIKSEIIPSYYGSTSYYNKKYMVIEFFEGQNLLKCEKGNLILVLDTLIKLQKTYWNKDIKIGKTLTYCFEKTQNRKNYLNNDILEKTYNEFLDIYLKCDKTIVHEDLLPFNLLIKEKQVKLIDWEHWGLLPYPLPIARLLAHTKEDINYIFYMKEEDKLFAIEYYYNNFIKNYNIDYKEYIKTMKYFLFYEYCEWIFVYNKYQNKKDDRYNYYIDKALNMVELLKEDDTFAF